MIIQLHLCEIAWELYDLMCQAREELAALGPNHDGSLLRDALAEGLKLAEERYQQHRVNCPDCEEMQ